MAEILVVEDEEDILTLVTRRLESGGHTVRAAPDGEHGLSLAVSTRPNVVVLDWMLPGYNGLEVCEQIRSDPDLAATKVLMLSAKVQQSDLDRAFKAGADDYLTKPFSPRELLLRVNALLSRP